jgi:hypothetical protein
LISSDFFNEEKMIENNPEPKGVDQLLKERMEFFPPPKSIGDAVVTAFVLQNLAGFKTFISDKPKSFQVAANKWVRESLEEVRRSRLHTEHANSLSLPDSFSEIPEFFEWYETLKQEAALASRNLASASKNQRN